MSRTTRILRLFPQRSLHISSILRAEDAATTATTPSAPSLTKEQLKRRELRRLLKQKADARKPASQHPLYMTIPMAMRYLRAAEVGQPTSQQTVSLTTLVVAEKGVPPLYGNVLFPTPLRTSKIAVFSNDPEKLAEIREKFNVYLTGGTELVEDIKNGKVKVDFDKAFATPDIANVLAGQLGRILGPKGVLPNVKKGTVSEDLVSLIRENTGSMPFRERKKCISIAIGNVQFSDRQIIENIIATRDAFRQAVATQKTKKPSILGKTVLSTAHGPGIVIDFN